MAKNSDLIKRAFSREGIDAVDLKIEADTFYSAIEYL